MLPTWLSASTHSVAYMVFSLSGFILLYTAFAIVEVYLMLLFIRKGPEEHGAAVPVPAVGPAGHALAAR